MKVLIGAFFQVVGVVFFGACFAYAAFYQEEEPTLSERCALDTIKWSAYNACWADDTCNLSDEEMGEMYRLGKSSLMLCTMGVTRGLIEGMHKPEPETEEVI